MIWVFAVIVVALVTIIVELLMVYQKRAHELRLRQEPIRSHIREHLRNMQDATLKIRKAATQKVEELDYAVKQLRKESENVSSAIDQLQETLAAELPPETDSVTDALTAPGPAAVVEPPDEDGPRQILREAMRRRDEIDGHITSLRRDLEIVRRTMERIDARMKRRLGSKNREERTP